MNPGRSCSLRFGRTFAYSSMTSTIHSGWTAPSPKPSEAARSPSTSNSFADTRKRMSDCLSSGSLKKSDSTMIRGRSWACVAAGSTHASIRAMTRNPATKERAVENATFSMWDSWSEGPRSPSNLPSPFLLDGPNELPWHCTRCATDYVGVEDDSCCCVRQPDIVRRRTWVDGRPHRCGSRPAGGRRASPPSARAGPRYPQSPAFSYCLRAGRPVCLELMSQSLV